MVKICEVVDGCENCPKYGDDCDGDKMAEHTDLISRADAIEAVNMLDIFPPTKDVVAMELMALPSDVKRERIAKSLLVVFRSVWCDRESDCWPYFNCSVCEFEDGEECRLKQFIKHTKYETEYPQGAIKSEVEE